MSDSPSSALYVVDLKKFRKIAAGDRLRGQYQGLSQDPNSLSNLDQVCVCAWVKWLAYTPSQVGPVSVVPLHAVFLEGKVPRSFIYRYTCWYWRLLFVSIGIIL